MLKEDFGLAAESFSIKPDPQVVFSHAAFRKVCGDILVSHLSQRRGLVLIAGEPGVGKSTLLLKLLADRQIAQSCVYLSCQTSPSLEVLLDWWCGKLGIAEDTDEHEARSKVLIDRLTQLLDSGGGSALLLDDAENLDEVALDSLRSLAELERGGRPLVQIILASRLRNENCPNRKPPDVAFPTRLEPVGPLEVGGYLLFRLSSAGYEGPPLFSTEAIQWIARVTQGNPRLINGLCQAALSLAAAENQPMVSAVIVEQALQEAPSMPQDSKTGACKDTLLLAGPALADTSPADQLQTNQRPETVWPIRLPSVPGQGHSTQGAVSARGILGVTSAWHQGLRFAAGLLAGVTIGAAGLFILKAYYGPGDKPSFDLLSAADRQKLDAATTPGELAASETESRTPVVRKIIVVEQTAEGMYVQTTEKPATMSGKDLAPSPPPEAERGFGSWFRELMGRLLPESKDSAQAGKKPER